ncbi:epoxide hydrolase [Fusarium fujikuroi]|nr:epoxide hydrolase [Fusarium fujikuroi]
MMALELPTRQTFTARSGNVYSYVFTPPTSESTTLLFLHGFPSTLKDWIHQIQHFSSQGYGIVAPDLLGYGESSKPTDVNAYRLKPMSDEVIQLLDHLDLKTLVGIGHDFGATLLSRMAAYYPSRWEALVFLAVGPPKLGTPFDVDMINTMTKQFLGYEMLGYIPWLADYRSQEILEKNAEAAMSLMFCRDREEWESWFHPLGKMEEFVREDRRLPIASWYTEDLQKAHLKAFGSTDGYKGVCRWYRMWKDNLFAPDEQGYEDFYISQPVLFIVPAEPEQSAAQQQQLISSWVPHLQTVNLNTSHWIHIQAPTETNTTIQNFLTSRRET